jgi:hypothetical protein
MMARFEFRVFWEITSVAGVNGRTEWEPWDGPQQTEDEVAAAVDASSGIVSLGLQSAINDSSFGYGVEVREVA